MHIELLDQGLQVRIAACSDTNLGNLIAIFQNENTPNNLTMTPGVGNSFAMVWEKGDFESF